MKKMHYLIGNWKSQKTTVEGEAWLSEFASIYKEDNNLQIVIAPTMLSLERLVAYSKKCRLENFSFAAQDLSQFPRGSYTGAVAADLLKGVAKYAIIGHSERLRYFHESVPEILKKAEEAAECGIVPLVCVQDEEMLSRLRLLEELETAPILAYTPPDPFISNTPESCEQVIAMAAKMRRTLPAARIIYGGAVTSENCKEYFSLAELDGLFIGRGSLDAGEFAALCNACIS